MEKKSLGTFIAVLRRASGMTQKELAEKLNVSDKAVSRWERDESAPDLTLIPVLAEIFGVTSDEILRGERRLQDDTNKETNPKRADKQLERLINKTKTRFNICSIISVGLILVGFVIALICNFGFNRSMIGFYLSTVFYVAAVTVSSIALVSSMSAFNIDEEEITRVTRAKRTIMIVFMATVSLAVIFTALSLPLIVLSYDSFSGLTASYWFGHGVAFASVTLGLCYTACVFIKRLPEMRLYFPETQNDGILFPIRKKLVLRLVLVLGITIILQLVWNVAATYELLTKGKRFEDHEEFKDYIETPTENTEQYYISNGIYTDAEPIDPPESDMTPEDIFDLEYVFDNNGETLFTFYHRNKEVIRIKYDWQDDGSLVLVTYTSEQIELGNNINNIGDAVFVIVYIAEMFLLFAKYRKEKNSILK